MTVYLVGAGPGDPGLMTARALELIAAADVIVYDRLIPDSALDGARADATLLYAGKEGGGPSMPQTEIERLLLEHGARGAEVVRLKGGDPFVFGRGGEEAEALRAGRDPVRGGARRDRGGRGPGVRRDPRDPPRGGERGRVPDGPRGPRQARGWLDWDALAAFPGTLVVYMGVRQLPRIARAPDRVRSLPRAAGRADRARHLPRSAHDPRHARHDRRGRAARGDPRAGDRRVRTGGVAAGPARLVRAPAAARGDRRRHQGARAGQRDGGEAAGRSARRVLECPGDPDRGSCRGRRPT